MLTFGHSYVNPAAMRSEGRRHDEKWVILPSYHDPLQRAYRIHWGWVRLSHPVGMALESEFKMFS